MIKRKKRKKKNQGNSFIIVIATLSFLAVLTTALLVAVALCYRLKAYDINSRDNFYYLEQAMDEIYEGVGAIVMENLNDAYNETTEVIVYFDPVKKAYVNMDNSDANTLMKSNFRLKVGKEDRFTSTNISNTLSSFITHPYDTAGAPEGVQLSVGNVVTSTGTDLLTIKDLILKREGQYSTITSSKSNSQAKSTFIQSITTDIVVTEPDFLIDFSANGDDNELYDFVMIADMGVEVNGITTQVDIGGNVYAAADFYNKEYGSATFAATTNDKSKPLTNTVNSYTSTKLDACNGISEQSMYSGFYLNGSRVSIVADKLIVPGSIAAMNCANLSVVGNMGKDGADNTQVWADGIVLGGYSRKKGSAEDSGYFGASMTMKGDAYIYDDLEVNATGSSFSLNGNYYGYNNGTTDKRRYSNAFVKKVAPGYNYEKIEFNDGVYTDKDNKVIHLPGQAHYNSSAVIINGDETTLDLSKTNAMYIAGQAYVELSKSTTTQTYALGADNVMGEVNAGTRDMDKVTVNQYEFKDYDSTDEQDYSVKEVKDEEGKVTETINTRIEDYKTGEGLSIKSNQLAYIPPYRVKSNDYGMYVEWPSIIQKDEFRTFWSNLEQVPVVKTVISGKEYYFYEFSNEADRAQYLKIYAEQFPDYPASGEPTGFSDGEAAEWYDIRDKDAIDVKVLNVVEDSIYSNSAISLKNSSQITIKADKKSADALVAATGALDQSLKSSWGSSTPTTDDEKKGYSINLTTGLQKEYKEMKMLLTSKSTNGEAKQCAYTAPESGITPINYYFDFSKLDSLSGGSLNTLIGDTNYRVILGKGDVTVSTDKMKGIIVCKGDVTFTDAVKEFEGLIVAGGKIKVNHSMDFLANREVVKAILRYEDEHNDTNGICALFRQYQRATTVTPDSGTAIPMKSISAVIYEDVLAFNNWKKNVD